MLIKMETKKTMWIYFTLSSDALQRLVAEWLPDVLSG